MPIWVLFAVYVFRGVGGRGGVGELYLGLVFVVSLSTCGCWYVSTYGCWYVNGTVFVRIGKL